MIKFQKLCHEKPFLLFKEKYDLAIKKKQKNVEAVNISSFSKTSNEVSSRMVNLKLISEKNFIFFTNYESPKSTDFIEHNQISAIFYWNNINVQIRIKALIKKTSKGFNKNYFLSRSKYKNALAISSEQSKIISSYETVMDRYNNSLKFDNLSQCPEYWGGYSFVPYYFEFWEGHESRINKRDVYSLEDSKWHHRVIQP